MMWNLETGGGSLCPVDPVVSHSVFHAGLQRVLAT